LIIGTSSLVRDGSPPGTGLIVSSSGVPIEVGDGDMGNLNSASGLGEVGDRRKPARGVSGAVATPGRRPLMLLSGGYEA
jgi:hypothetical protein